MEYIIGILLLISFVGFRWYGGSDPVTLDKIRQIPGMRSIVSAVYDVKPGEVWPEESIKHLVDECREHGLIFDVVESIPVAEECSVVMALHPDDPPYPIFGLPRVITCEENLDLLWTARLTACVCVQDPWGVRRKMISRLWYANILQ